MSKLPILESKKKHIKNINHHFPKKASKKICTTQNEDDKEKNNLLGNNYDKVINYYQKNIKNDKV